MASRKMKPTFDDLEFFLRRYNGEWMLIYARCGIRDLAETMIASQAASRLQDSSRPKLHLASFHGSSWTFALVSLGSYQSLPCQNLCERLGVEIFEYGSENTSGVESMTLFRPNEASLTFCTEETLELLCDYDESIAEYCDESVDSQLQNYSPPSRQSVSTLEEIFNQYQLPIPRVVGVKALADFVIAMHEEAAETMTLDAHFEI